MPVYVSGSSLVLRRKLRQTEHDYHPQRKGEGFMRGFEHHMSMKDGKSPLGPSQLFNVTVDRINNSTTVASHVFGKGKC